MVLLPVLFSGRARNSFVSISLDVVDNPSAPQLRGYDAWRSARGIEENRTRMSKIERRNHALVARTLGTIAAELRQGTGGGEVGNVRGQRFWRRSKVRSKWHATCGRADNVDPSTSTTENEPREYELVGRVERLIARCPAKERDGGKFHRRTVPSLSSQWTIKNIFIF